MDGYYDVFMFTPEGCMGVLFEIDSGEAARWFMASPYKLARFNAETIPSLYRPREE